MLGTDLQVANRTTCNDVWIEQVQTFIMSATPWNEFVTTRKDTRDDGPVRRKIRGTSCPCSISADEALASRHTAE